MRLAWQASEQAGAVAGRPEPAARSSRGVRHTRGARRNRAQRLREGYMAVLTPRHAAAIVAALLALVAAPAARSGAGRADRVPGQGGVPLQLLAIRRLAGRGVRRRALTVGHRRARQRSVRRDAR